MDRRGHFGPRLGRWILLLISVVWVPASPIAAEEHYSNAHKNCRVGAEVSLPRSKGKKVKGRPSWAGWQVGGGGKLLGVRGAALTWLDPATGAETEVRGGLGTERSAQAAAGPAGIFILDTPAPVGATPSPAQFSAYSADGKRRLWSVTPFPDVDLALVATPLASSDRVFVAVADRAAAFELSAGSASWSRRLLGYVGCCPALAGNALVQPTSHGLVALAASDGRELWTRPLDPQTFNPRRGPAIEGARVYIALDERSVSALDAVTGTLLWTSPPLPSAVDHRHPPVAGAFGVLVSLYEGVARLSPDGTLVWARTYDFLKMRSADPALLAASNAAFLGGADGVHAVSLATGEPLWTETGLGQVLDLEYIAPDLVAVTSSGDVVAFAPGNP